MSHEINSMAYAGSKPWHGLGVALPADAPLDVWAQCAGMQWRICESPVQYRVAGASDPHYEPFKNYKVLFRSDTLAPLSVVSKDYHLVQPSQVLEFFRDLVQTQGYQIETAGCLRGGRKFWALTRMQDVLDLPGNDKVEGYLLMASSCDGSLATVVIPTSIRVVCANTLHATLHDTESHVRIPHTREFDADWVCARLDLARQQWTDYAHLMQSMARKQVSALKRCASLNWRSVELKPMLASPLNSRRGAPCSPCKTCTQVLARDHNWNQHAGRYGD